MKGLIIIAILAISYFVATHLFFKFLVYLFPKKPTMYFLPLSLIVPPFIALIIGLLYLKLFKK
jgi:hypothetical protein